MCLKFLIMRNIWYYIFVLFCPYFLFGTWFNSIPRTVIQPNGEKVECYITGDQYARRLHDSDNFTIVMNIDDGFYYYAKKDEGNNIIPSSLIVGRGDPTSIGIEPGYSIGIEEYIRKKRFYNHISDAHNASRRIPE